MTLGARAAEVARKTNETDIKLSFGVDGTGSVDIETDVPFLNHMLDLFAKHGQFDLTVEARGDVDIDDHHTVEDIGICLGQTLREALGDKAGIKRYASVFVPMDEALAQVIVDISNRPHFEYRAEYPSAQVGSFSTERPSAMAPDDTTRISRLSLCSAAMSSASEDSHCSCSRPACASTSSDEPTLTTMRRKSLSDGAFRDMAPMSRILTARPQEEPVRMVASPPPFFPHGRHPARAPCR